MIGEVSFGGVLQTKVNRAKQAPLSWRIQNALRLGYLRGWIAKHAVVPFAKAWGVATILGEIEIRVRKASGEWINYGVVSYRVVTDVGVAFIVDAWDNTVELEIMNYHGCGTGGTAEAAGDTALVTESTTALNPNSTRATGTQSQPAANQYRSTGTLTFDASAAITEHGLFSVSSTGSGVLFDRSLFSAINVASGDSIQFQYTATLTSGS